MSEQSAPSITLLSLPDETIVHALSFLYQNETRPRDVNITSLLEQHSQMHMLYGEFPSLRTFLDELVRQEGSFFLASSSSSASSPHPLAQGLKLIQDADVEHYDCSGETRGGTGGEGIKNILREGDHAWNKWYDPTLRLDVNPFYAQLSFPRPIRLLAYGIKSANDVPQRDPKDWRLLLSDRSRREMSYRPYSKFVTAHQVEDHAFTRRYETCWFTLPIEAQRRELSPSTTTVRLAIDDTRVDGFGTQIAHLYLVVADD